MVSWRSPASDRCASSCRIHVFCGLLGVAVCQQAPGERHLTCMRHTHISASSTRCCTSAQYTVLTASQTARRFVPLALCPRTSAPDPNLYVLSSTPAMAREDVGSHGLHKELSGLSATEIHVSRSGDVQEEGEDGVVLGSLDNLVDSISLGA
jgi:hypothetical protein